MFLKLIDGAWQPYSLEQLRVDNPNVSFPNALSEDVLDAYGLKHDPLWGAAPPAELTTQSIEPLEKTVRKKRNELLAASDWTQLKDSQLEENQLDDWQNYRQLLRDITTQPGFPEQVNWPVAPAKQ